jgi:AraC family transcriptional regulator
MMASSPTPEIAPVLEHNASRLAQLGLLPPPQWPRFPGWQSRVIKNRPDDGLSSRQPARLAPTVEISPADIVKRRTATWDGMTIEIVQTTGAQRMDARFRGPRHLLVVHEQDARLNGESSVEGLPSSRLHHVRGKLTFVPAGCEYREWQELRGPARIAYFYLESSKMPAQPQIAGTVSRPRLFFEDAALSDTASKLIRLVEDANGDNRLYLQALGAVLMHELMRPNATGQRSEAPARGGLAGWQQRIVTAYIEEHLAERISLAALARLVRLSPYYFCRAFKQSFGMPPHRYHNSRRMVQAKALLALPAPSVTDIGMRIGFSDTSSFTTAFRKATGLTPTAYHRSLS